MADPQYRIGTLARLTGVTTHALRIWERRYGAFSPMRTPKGARLYSNHDVLRVQLIKELLDRGHNIGNVARLSEEALRELRARGSQETTSSASPSDTRELQTELLSAVSELDVTRASRALEQAAAQLSRRDLILDVIAPVLEKVGNLWEAGEIGIASEHAVSALLRTQLGGLLNATPVKDSAPVICTTLAGELHEMGALLVALMFALHDQRALFLGPNLPAHQILETARVTGATAVALSFVASEAASVRTELDIIVKDLPADVELILGGRLVSNLRPLPKRARVFEDLRSFATWLEQTTP
jgi:DNA-binding transcriptional MerR regulator